jgi:hypothetical protein
VPCRLSTLRRLGKLRLLGHFIPLDAVPSLFSFVLGRAASGNGGLFLSVFQTHGVSPGALSAIRTAPAYFSSTTEVFVAFQGRGIDCPAGIQGDLTALRIAAGSPPTLSVAWCAEEKGRGSPIVTTTDGKANPIVWAIGAEGDNRLHGCRGDTGAVIFSGGGPAEAMTQVRRFQTLIAAGGRLYVAADEHIYAFVF